MADWRSGKCSYENSFYGSKTYSKCLVPHYICIVIIIATISGYSQWSKAIHRYGYPTLSNWMDSYSNNEWLSISPLSMKFNEQPYLLKCVCLCVPFTHCMFVQLYMKWQTHVLMTTSVCNVYTSSHTDFTTQTDGPVAVFVCSFFIRVCIQDRIDAHINTQILVGVVTDIDIFKC